MSAPAAIDPEYVAELERRLAMANAANRRLAAANGALEEANARLERLLAQARHEKFGPEKL